MTYPPPEPRMRIPSTVPSPRTTALTSAAMASAPSAYASAARRGARVVQLATPDAFGVVYTPSPRPRGVIVSLPGTASHAAVAADRWIPHCTRRGLALVVVQWWDGASGYLSPAEIADVALKLLSLCQAHTLPRVVHGHSRGATQLYRLMGEPGGEHLAADGYLIECGAWEEDWAPHPDAAGQRVVLVAGRGDTTVLPASMWVSADELARLGAVTKVLQVGTGVSPTDHRALTREPETADAALEFLLEGE